jgi:soluble lytic murein transglycosylase-like protein
MEEGINEYIQNNPVVKKQGGSPVSAKMILNTAKKYNVDPALIMSIAQVDSHFGTIGKAKRTRNPGN